MILFLLAGSAAVILARGIFYVIMGLTGIPANQVFGAIVPRYGKQAAYHTGTARASAYAGCMLTRAPLFLQQARHHAEVNPESL